MSYDSFMSVLQVLAGVLVIAWMAVLTGYSVFFFFLSFTVKGRKIFEAERIQAREIRKLNNEYELKRLEIVKHYKAIKQIIRQSDINDSTEIGSPGVEI